MKKTSSVIAALLVAATPALALAQLVINPAIPTDVEVTGSGANADGYVELFINGTSAGSVQADGSGDWVFPATLAEGDVLTAIPARVWNFNDDGDAEGWFSPDDTITVAGGIMTVTEVAGGNMTIAYNETGLADPNVQRVLEIGYRFTGTVTAPGVTLTNSDQGGAFGPNWTPTQSAGFRSDLIDLTDLFADQAYTPNLGWSGIVDQIGFGFNGTGVGDTMEIDFIRLRESYRFEFPFDDAQGWAAVDANTVVTGVSNGVLSAEAAAPGVNIQLAPAFQQINSSVFNQYNVLMTQYADETEQPVQVSGVAFFNNGFDSWTAQFIPTAAYGADYGNPILVSLDLSAEAAWNTPLIALNAADAFMFAPQAGDSVEIDYIEFAPENTIGDAAPVTVTEVTSVYDWTLFQ